MADNRQRYVTGDTLAHVAVVAVRDIKTICGRAISKSIEPGYVKRETAFIAGLPDTIRENLILCRQLHARFLRGDYRMSEPEYDRFLCAVDWLQRLDRELKGQPDKPPVNWNEHRDKVFCETRVRAGTYPELVRRLIAGDLDRAVSE